MGLPAGTDRAVRSGRAHRALIALLVCAAGGFVLPAASAVGATGDDAHRHGYPDGPRPAPHCASRICVHWVESGPDAPAPADGDADATPDEVEAIAAAFEETYRAQTTPAGLGWREPPGDGSAGGGGDKIDVYVKAGPFKGRTWADRDGSGNRSQPAYVLVAPRLATDVLRYVAAHELAHVVQHGYDSSAPHWLYEATATWVEAKVVPELDSWQRHLPVWAQATESTVFGGTQKAYGSAVWLHWLDGRYGEATVREVWEELPSHAAETGDLDAFDAVLRAHGAGGLHEEHGSFAAGLPEWRRAGSGFPRPATLPDVERRATIVPDAAAGPVDVRRGSFTLFDVPADGARSLRLDASLPAGLPGAIALVGRIGTAETGRAITVRAHLPHGGAGSVTLTAGEPLSRVTAVIVDAYQYTLEPEPGPPTARITTLARAPGTAPAESPAPLPTLLVPGAAPCCAVGVPPRTVAQRQRPGRVRGLRARRRGSRLTLTWARAPGATSYRVTVRDGRRDLRRTTKARRSLVRVRARAQRVTVVAVNAAGRGPATTVIARGPRGLRRDAAR